MIDIFKKKTDKEKKIRKLESQLIKHKQKRNFLMPRAKNNLFSNDIELETISDDRIERIRKIDKEIISVKKDIKKIKKGESNADS